MGKTGPRPNEPSLTKATGGERLLLLRMFGQMEVLVRGRDVSREISRRGLWVLAILGLQNGSPIERQRLAGLVWPDSTDASALFNLRQTLAALRRILAEAKDCIVSVSPRSVKFDISAVGVDVGEFATACTDGGPASLQKALDLYRGPLLVGCDEPFADEERRLAEEEFLNASEKLAAHYESIGSEHDATRVLRRALAVDPYREIACRRLMTILSDRGEAAAAQELYRELRLRLRSDLSTEPHPETKELYRSIRKIALHAAAGDASEVRLPVPMSRLVGRASEIQHVASLFKRCRLVTLTGVGGVGKTRLAIAVARSVAAQYLHGARFADFSPVQNEIAVPYAIASALGIEEQPGKALLDTVSEKLSDSEQFIVFDNCEHVAAAASAATEMLLSAAPGLHILATSRQPLEVDGEFVWRVPSMGVPISNGQAKSAEERAKYLADCDSVKLFLDRSHFPESQPPTAKEMESIGSICARLDGIPLAIELAAARTNVLSVKDIETRLIDRFSLLSSGNKSLPRHRTLRAAMEWSWDLLTPGGQQLLMALSVFQGGCSLDAAETVAAIDEPVLDLLTSLVDRSLLTMSRTPDGARYSMLETVRQFATEKLTANAALHAARDKHGEYFLNWAEDARSRQRGPEESLWFERYERDHDNFRAALDWFRAAGRYEDELRLAVAMCRFWDTYGHLNEGRVQIEKALTHSTEKMPMRLRADAYTHAAWMATVQRDCVVAAQYYEEWLRRFRELGDDRAIANILNCLGLNYAYAGNPLAAMPCFEESLAISRKIGHVNGAAMTLANMGEAALGLKDTPLARRYFEESITERGGDLLDSREGVGITICNLSVVDLLEGKRDEAIRHALQGLELLRDAGSMVYVPVALNQLGAIMAAVGKWERAGVLLSVAKVLAEAQGTPLDDYVSLGKDESLARCREALGSEAFEAACAIGRQMKPEDAIAFGLACTLN